MKKGIATFLCIAFTLLLIVGCGGDAGTPATPDTPAADAPAADTPAADEPAEAPSEAPEGAIELQMWHYFGDAEAGSLNDYTARFTEEVRPDVHITVTMVPREDLLQQYTRGALTGDLPDIGMVDNPDHASFSVMGAFEDITDLVDAWGEMHYFFDGPMMSAMWEGRVFGLPNNSNCLALFYNVDMLEAAGVDVPTTWDELESAAAALTDGDTYGLAISMTTGEEGTFQFMPWFISAGGSIDDLAGGPPAKALAEIQKLIDQGSMSPEVVGWGQGDANTQFINGRTAMQVNGPWNVPNILADAPDLNWKVALFPKDVKYASVLGGENFAIGANTTDIQASWDFISWFHSTENNAKWAMDSGKFPTRSDSLELMVWSDDVADVYSVFGEGLQYAMPRGPHPRWPEISRAISDAIQAVLAGGADPESAMQEAATKYAELVG